MPETELPAEEQLKRFLYLSSYDDKFITGDVEKHCFYKCEHELIKEFVKTNHTVFLKIVESAGKDELLPRRKTLLFALAVALNSDLNVITAATRHEICTTAFSVCKTDQEFFCFVRYYTSITKRKTRIPTTLRKAIVKFYKQKTSLDLANSYVQAKSYHSWKHKDLLKLAHYKPEDDLKIFVITSIMQDLKNIKPDTVLEGEKEQIVILLKRIAELRKTTDEAVAVPLILELHACFQQMNSKLNKYPEVWAAVVQEVSTRTVLAYLPKFYKMGFLKSSCPVYAKVNDALTNPESIKSCNLHPIEVFIYLKNFEKGGKPMDPKLIEFLSSNANMKKGEESTVGDSSNEKAETTVKTEKSGESSKGHCEPKCPVISKLINKCLSLAQCNLRSLDKHIMITIDASEKGKQHCLHNRNITCLEAAVAVTLNIYKADTNVTVALFNGPNIQLLPLQKDNTIAQVYQQINNKPKPFTLPTPVFDWALASKKNIDLFINFIHSDKFLKEASESDRNQYDRNLEKFKEYQEQMNMPNAKLATVCLSSTKLSLANKSRNIIDIAGFTSDIILVLEAFCNDSFN